MAPKRGRERLKSEHRRARQCLAGSKHTEDDLGTFTRSARATSLAEAIGLILRSRSGLPPALRSSLPPSGTDHEQVRGRATGYSNHHLAQRVPDVLRGCRLSRKRGMTGRKMTGVQRASPRVRDWSRMQRWRCLHIGQVHAGISVQYVLEHRLSQGGSELTKARRPALAYRTRSSATPRFLRTQETCHHGTASGAESQ